MSGLSPSEPPIVAFFFLKQKTAYEMRIRDWSSDVCSSDLLTVTPHVYTEVLPALEVEYRRMTSMGPFEIGGIGTYGSRVPASELPLPGASERDLRGYVYGNGRRSEEHKSELQSLMRISYAVFCWKQKKQKLQNKTTPTTT